MLPTLQCAPALGRCQYGAAQYGGVLGRCHEGLHSPATKTAHPPCRGIRPGRWHDIQAAQFDDGSAVARPLPWGMHPVFRQCCRPLAALGRRRTSRHPAAAGVPRLSGIYRTPAGGGRNARSGGAGSRSGHERKRCCDAGPRSRQEPSSGRRYGGCGKRLVLAAAHYALPSSSAVGVRFRDIDQATPARSRSWKCTMPTGAPRSTTNSAVIFDEFSSCNASLASWSGRTVFGDCVIT